MDMLSSNILILLLFSSILPKFTTSAACNAGSNTGENNPKDKDLAVDSTTGLTILLDAPDNEFTFDCCGIITGWDYYTKTNTGTVYFQVWRRGSSTWSLVGENAHTITTTNAVQSATPASSDRIIFQSGDILGLHFPGAAVISYDWGYLWKATTSYSQGQATYNWDSEATQTNRDYGFHANTEPTTAPTFDNLDTTVTHSDTLAVGYTLITLTVSDVDNGDTITTYLVSNGSPTMFEYDAVTMNVKTKASLTSGTYEMAFRASDVCSQSSTGTLTIVLTNEPPIIHNLPSYAEVNEDQSSELTLYVINATDSHDSVTCSITSPASSPFSTKLSPGSTNYAIYVTSNPNLNYLTQKRYDLTVQCTDGKDPVTSTFTVYILKNAQPSFTNLQNRVEVSATGTSIGTTIFTVSASDPEGDSLTYRLTCDTSTCPFTFSGSGNVETTTLLSTYTIPGYDIYVYVSDGYQEVGPKTLSVIVKDLNSAPIITNLPLPSAILVDENIALGTELYTVKSLDVNSGDTLTFTVTSSPLGGLTYIDVNATSGVIKTSSTYNLNYEDLTSSGVGTTFTLTIFVSDGQATASQSLIIDISDINEAPYFQKSIFAMSGDEGTVGNTLTNPGFVVTDPDGDTVSYRMDCGQYSAYFSIDSSTADIVFSWAYDLDTGSNPALVTCTVTSSDGEFTATATVEITVNDVNDNIPAFSQPLYTFYLSPSTSVNTVLGDISASDADSGTYGTLYYNLNQTTLAKEYFGITGSSLFIKNSLTDFSDGTILTIMAIVTDGGGLQDKATITLVLPDTTKTTVVTSTTERYYTFFEDSRNTAWFTCLAAFMVAAGIAVGYLFYKYCRISDCKQMCNRKKLWEPGKTQDNQQSKEVNRQKYKNQQAKVHKMWEPGRARI